MVNCIFGSFIKGPDRYLVQMLKIARGGHVIVGIFTFEK